jgi:hypothetical protein
MQSSGHKCQIYRQVWAFLALALFFQPALGERICSKAHGKAGVSVADFSKDTDPGYEQRIQKHREDHIQQFWHIHKRYGIARSSEGRFILAVVKDEGGLAKTLIDELKAYYRQPQMEIPELPNSPIPAHPEKGSISFDVTDLLSDLDRRALDRKQNGGGPNCINFCLVYAGLTSNLHYTGSAEAEILPTLSALFTEITNPQNLKPDDTFILDHFNSSGNRQFLHAAIYISPHWVKDRNGKDGQHAYLHDPRELWGGYTAKGNPLRILRLKSLAQLKQEYLGNLPKHMTETWLRAEEIEAQLEAFHYGNVFEKIKAQLATEPYSRENLKKRIDHFHQLIEERRSQIEARLYFSIGGIHEQIDNYHQAIEALRDQMESSYSEGKEIDRGAFIYNWKRSIKAYSLAQSGFLYYEIAIFKDNMANDADNPQNKILLDLWRLLKARVISLEMAANQL